MGCSRVYIALQCLCVNIYVLYICSELKQHIPAYFTSLSAQNAELLYSHVIGIGYYQLPPHFRIKMYMSNKNIKAHCETVPWYVSNLYAYTFIHMC